MRTMCCAALALMLSADAGAAVAYVQPPAPTGGLLQSSRRLPDGTETDEYVWDSFQVPVAMPISEIRWRGGFDPARFGLGGPIIGFIVEIYPTNQAGSPDIVNPPLVRHEIAGNAGQVSAGTFGGAAMYDYHFVLPTPFMAAAGTKYWVQIEALQGNIPDWGLSRSTLGDGSYFRRVPGVGGGVRYQFIAGDAAFTLVTTTVQPPSTNVVIDEVRTRGPQGAADEFIELRNVSAATVDLSGWQVLTGDAAGTAELRATIGTGVTLGAGCAYLLTNSGAGGYSGTVPGNRTFTGGIADNGGIALRNGAGVTVDQIGMSPGAVFVEGTPLPAFGSTDSDRSYGRTGPDTNDNATDFLMAAPSTPENASAACLGGTASPTNPSGVGSAQPALVHVGDVVHLTVAVTPGVNPLSSGLTVAVDARALSAAASVPLLDTGSAGGCDSVAGDGTFAACVSVDVSARAGAWSLPVAIHDAQGRTGTTAITVTVPMFTRYFAEGATSDFFDTQFALLNPWSADAHVNVSYMKSDGTVVPYAITAGPHSRVTIDPKSIAGLDVAEFSTLIESDVLVVADRTMTWDRTAYGSHAETGVPAPATTWFLAEGATHSGFQLFYLLQNPNASQARVSIEFLRPSPNRSITRVYDVPPRSRFNVWVNTENGLGDTDVSATITSSLPVIVERAMYLDAPGQPFAAGHESAGVTAPSTHWFLAEGATGRTFDLFVLMANPGSTVATCDVSFLLPDGTVIHRPTSIAPRSRGNIWVDAEGGVLADTAVSTTVSCDLPIIVERAMWWPGPTAATWAEAHNSPGATSTGTTWALAEGEQGGPRDVDTYILVANTSDFGGAVRVTLFFEDGTTAELVLPVSASSRTNVALGEPQALGGFGALAANRRFGAIIESLVADGGQAAAQIVVERAMYSNAGGTDWAAGTNALATKLR